MRNILLPIFLLGLVSCSQTNRQSEFQTTDSTLAQDNFGNEYERALVYRDLDSDSLLADKNDQSKLFGLLTKGTKIKEKEGVVGIAMENSNN